MLHFILQQKGLKNKPFVVKNSKKYTKLEKTSKTIFVA